MATMTVMRMTMNNDDEWRHITTVARTERRISFIFFWRRPLIETEIAVGCVRFNLHNEWNRNVFRSRRNESIDRSSFSSVGSLFHARGAATEKALSPIRRCINKWNTDDGNTYSDNDDDDNDDEWPLVLYLRGRFSCGVAGLMKCWL